MKSFLLLLSLTLCLALAGCESGGGGASSGIAALHGGSLVEQERKLYFGRCTACHTPEPVRDYTRAGWAGIIPDMAEEANMDVAQMAALRASVESQL